MYDENFSPNISHPRENASQNDKETKREAPSTGSPAVAMTTTANSSYAFTQEYSQPSELGSQAWFVDSGASHHLTHFETCFHSK